MMDFSISSIKREAKDKLSGKWGYAIALLVIIGVVQIGTSIGGAFIDDKQHMASFLIDIVSTIASSIMTLASVKLYLDITREKKVDAFESIQFGCGNVIKGFLATVIVGLITFIGYLLLIVPGVILSIRYMFVLYIIADNTEISIGDALKESKDLTDGNKMDLFIFGLSFLPWLFVIVLTLGLGMLYVGPYMNASTAVYYNRLKQQRMGHNENIDTNTTYENEEQFF